MPLENQSERFNQILSTEKRCVNRLFFADLAARLELSKDLSRMLSFVFSGFCSRRSSHMRRSGWITIKSTRLEIKAIKAIPLGLIVGILEF